jgi:hypothetical protein
VAWMGSRSGKVVARSQPVSQADPPLNFVLTCVEAGVETKLVSFGAKARELAFRRAHLTNLEFELAKVR